MSHTRVDGKDSSHTLVSPLITKAIAAMGTGVSCAGLFHFYDRALYLSVIEKRPFLSRENFRQPLHGVVQTCIQRAFTWGVYYVAQSQMEENIYPILREKYAFSESSAKLCVGLSAGSINGIIANPVSAVKYHTWGKEERNFYNSASEMWKANGIKPFFRGVGATMTRDLFYGGAYEMMRHLLEKKIHKADQKSTSTTFICNFIASGTATIFSSPINYVRNIQYSTASMGKTHSIPQVLQNVIHESKAQSSTKNSLFFLQQRFRIGWGTARVALGMAVGQKIYDASREQLEKITLTSSQRMVANSVKPD